MTVPVLMRCQWLTFVGDYVCIGCLFRFFKGDCTGQEVAEAVVTSTLSNATSAAVGIGAKVLVGKAVTAMTTAGWVGTTGGSALAASAASFVLPAIAAT